MRFFIRKRRQTPTVIIVALIDVLIVLLIFLMVTTTFKQQPSLRLALPETTHAQKSGANENAPLIVSIDSKGALRLGAEALPVTDERLKSELQTVVEKNPQIQLAISADKNAPFGQIVKVMDAAKDAKIKSVNAFTKEAQKQ
ncbi:MAG TPA: biopolymer transporter ExbD [Verrucomicrobiae bacterium]|nr:biopolymer transporter ExbD [Verrucomicrobiae bacterium]